MMMTEQKKIYRVIEITRLIRRSLEGEFRDIWIEGEVSNLRTPKSGHIYFTIKDEDSQIPAVKFRPHAGDFFKQMRDGDKIRAFGSISVYEKAGQYQLYVREAEKLGIGDLQARFSELKEKLQKEGLFDRERKKPIPMLPSRIGIVTSPTGAAIRDMLNVLGRRFSNVHVIIFPVKVQGEGAAEEIAGALDAMNAMGEADVIIVGRGGGSFEDLWAFNEETVARAIFRSRIPVISAVGHEIDFTIADFVADLRAETPTAAAELVLQKKSELARSVQWGREKLVQSATGLVRDRRALLRRYADHYALMSPQNRLAQSRQAVDETDWKLRKMIRERLALSLGRVQKEREKLSALNPLSILRRGYSITQDFDTQKIVSDVKSLKKNAKLRTVLHRGTVVSTVEATEEGGHLGEGDP